MGGRRRQQQPQPSPRLRKKVPLCSQRSGSASGASSSNQLAPLSGAGGSPLPIQKGPVGQSLLPTLVSEVPDSSSILTQPQRQFSLSLVTGLP